MAHILIIDDNPDFRLMLKDMLTDLGHTVGEASDGGKGGDLYRQGGFDLVFTDVIMPGKEGVETILMLRSLDPAVKIVVMSGGGEVGPDDYLNMALQLGAKRALKKPFRLEDVRKVIGEVLAI